MRRFPRAFLHLALVLLAPALLAAQGTELPPAFLREHALVVRFLASAFDLPPERAPAVPAAPAGTAQPNQQGGQASRSPTWTSSNLRYTVSGSPVAIRLAGDNLVVVVQVTPYDHGDRGLMVVAQGQVWKKRDDGQFDYRSAFESLVVAFGEAVYFYPLGMRSDGSAPIRLEIVVDHLGAAGPELQSESPPGTTPAPQGKR